MNLQKLTSGLRKPAFFSPVFTHRLHKTWQYSDGVRENMLITRSSWVVERIFALQDDESALKNAQIQLWDFKIFPDQSILLACRDDCGNVLYYEHRDPVDYPEEDLAFVLDHGVLRMRD